MDENVDIEVEDAPRPDYRILILAAAAGTAVVLFFFARALSKRSPLPENAQAAMDAGDWRASIEHLAAGWETRFMLLQEQLDRLSGDSAPAPPAPAAFSDVAVSGYGAPNVDRVPPDMSVVGAEEPPPPAPASFSMPPE